MKITAALQHLAKLLAEHGDLEVEFQLASQKRLVKRKGRAAVPVSVASPDGPTPGGVELECKICMAPILLRKNTKPGSRFQCTNCGLDYVYMPQTAGRPQGHALDDPLLRRVAESGDWKGEAKV